MIKILGLTFKTSQELDHERMRQFVNDELRGGTLSAEIANQLRQRYPEMEEHVMTEHVVIALEHAYRVRLSAIRMK